MSKKKWGSLSNSGFSIPGGSPSKARKEKGYLVITSIHSFRKRAQHTPKTERVVSNVAGETGWEQVMQASCSILRATGSYRRVLPRWGESVWFPKHYILDKIMAIQMWQSTTLRLFLQPAMPWATQALIPLCRTSSYLKMKQKYSFFSLILCHFQDFRSVDSKCLE